MNTTDEKIQTALLTLMKERRIEDVTMIAVANRSQVNRTTIYRHYNDKYAILQAIEENVLQNLEIKAAKTQNDILLILRSISEKREIISILLSENGDPRFYEYFITFLAKKGLQTIDSLPRFNCLDHRQKELLVQYISSALLGLVKYWLIHPEMEVDELDLFFNKLFINGINSLTSSEGKVSN